ncbi:hypothetical protein FOZ60_004228 [Perkinsus olseni]|uniref:C3H1-type domain-containing protein n=2 Tax=Perkinsus olseni TaxID=32597 RepID=A0A7J6NVX3_PEROL|nr:hypothetical protein FOZ60_004228 [Perkinsus olseni]
MSSIRIESTADVVASSEPYPGEAVSGGYSAVETKPAEGVQEDLRRSGSTHSDVSAKEPAKTKPLCDHFKRGKCRLENSCRFAHSLKEHNDPSLITKRRVEAKAQQKLLRMRKREAEKSTAELTSAGDSDSLSSCSPPASPRYCSFSRNGVSPQMPPYGLPKRASTGSLPSMAVSYSNCYGPLPVYYSPVCYSSPCYVSTPGAYYVVQQPQWEPESPCYAAAPEYYTHPQQQVMTPGSSFGVRRSASCSMVQTPTYAKPRMYSEEHYED